MHPTMGILLPLNLTLPPWVQATLDKANLLRFPACPDADTFRNVRPDRFGAEGGVVRPPQTPESPSAPRLAEAVVNAGQVHDMT